LGGEQGPARKVFCGDEKTLALGGKGGSFIWKRHPYQSIIGSKRKKKGLVTSGGKTCSDMLQRQEEKKNCFIERKNLLEGKNGYFSSPS